MNSDAHTKRLSVSLGGNKVGELGQAPKGGIFFEYDKGWLESGFPLTKMHLKFEPGLQSGGEREFFGLHGVFNDSLPDGWGMLLMDKAFRASRGWSREFITGLDRLAFIGNRGMGALEYAPMSAEAPVESALDLSQLARAADRVDSGHDVDVLRTLTLHGGSGGGARPKVTLARNVVDGRCMSGFEELQPGYEHWMVKFRHHGEPIDTGRAERAYAQMALAAGIHVPQVDLIPVNVDGQPEAYFASKRFDREGNRKIHMLSVSGLLHASHRTPSVDYEGILGSTRLLTHSQVEVTKMFRHMVFNVVTYNRDDHTKNFAFLCQDGVWKVSPAYDLSMSPNAGMFFHHMAAVAGESSNPTLKHVLEVANIFDIDDARGIVAEVVEAASRWRAHASAFDVSEQLTDDIAERIEEMIDFIKPASKPRPR